MPKYNETRVKSNNSTLTFAPFSAKTESENILVQCGLDELAKILSSLCSKKNLTINLYVMSVGNITNSNVSGVNVLSNHTAL